MRLTISWTTHNRRYSINLVEFLKVAGIVVSEDELKAAAKKLLEQNALQEDEPKH
jgi:hypothetical protein